MKVLIAALVLAQATSTQGTTFGSLPYSETLNNVIATCTGDYMSGYVFKANAAIEISDWSMSEVIQSAGEDASECFDRYHHPLYAIEKAFFYLQTARLVMRENEPDIKKATTLGLVATTALNEASKYKLHGNTAKLYNSVEALDELTLRELKAAVPD